MLEKLTIGLCKISTSILSKDVNFVFFFGLVQDLSNSYFSFSGDGKQDKDIYCLGVCYWGRAF